MYHGSKSMLRWGMKIDSRFIDRRLIYIFKGNQRYWHGVDLNRNQSTSKTHYKSSSPSTSTYWRATYCKMLICRHVDCWLITRLSPIIIPPHPIQSVKTCFYIAASKCSAERRLDFKEDLMILKFDVKSFHFLVSIVAISHFLLTRCFQLHNA